jgi:hypothetical protein
VHFEEFAVSIDLLAMPQAVQFVARESELEMMHQILYSRESQSAVVLHGLGGIGKTQLAIKYVGRHKEKYTATFWLNANDEDSLKLSFRRVAKQILTNYPLTSIFVNVDLEGELDQVVQAVKSWLCLPKNRRWLIVYDNYDNPKIPENAYPFAVDIHYYLPSAEHGSIIITTRSARVTHGQRLHVQKLRNVEESLEILSTASGRNGTTSGLCSLQVQ